jgi:hypothetical protein
MSKLIKPFGFTREETFLDIDSDTEVFIVLPVVLVFDILTLPLAILWIAGVGRDESE